MGWRCPAAGPAARPGGPYCRHGGGRAAGAGRRRPMAVGGALDA